MKKVFYILFLIAFNIAICQENKVANKIDNKENTSNKNIKTQSANIAKDSKLDSKNKKIKTSQEGEYEVTEEESMENAHLKDEMMQKKASVPRQFFKLSYKNPFIINNTFTGNIKALNIGYGIILPAIKTGLDISINTGNIHAVQNDLYSMYFVGGTITSRNIFLHNDYGYNGVTSAIGFSSIFDSQQIGVGSSSLLLKYGFSFTKNNINLINTPYIKYQLYAYNDKNMMLNNAFSLGFESRYQGQKFGAFIDVFLSYALSKNLANNLFVLTPEANFLILNDSYVGLKFGANIITYKKLAIMASVDAYRAFNFPSTIIIPQISINYRFF